MMKTSDRRRSLSWKAAKISTVTMFLANVILLAAVFALMLVNTIRTERTDLLQMMEQLSDRVIHVGTPSRIAFSNVTLRDGLNFGLYGMDGTPLYLSSYGMPSTEIEAYAPKLEFFDHTDYTTFEHAREEKDLILHAACIVHNDEESLVLHVVSDITYLMKPIRAMMRLMVVYLPVALLIAILLGRYTSRKIMQPIHTMTECIADKTSGDLFEQIDLMETTSEFDDLVKAFNSLMSRLEASFRQQKDFIANASHELRTPLAVINGHLSMLLRWGKDESEVLGKSLLVLQKETKLMTDMVQELLLLSRADRARTQNHNIETFSVYELLDDVKNDAKMTRPDVCIEIKADRALCCMSERSLLKQVLRILVDNSMRYCSPPGVITLMAEGRETDIVLAVKDMGIGIAPENLERIFERFYRVDTDEKEQRGNSGLGLAIAKSVVTSLGGTIHAESELHAWTTITVTLPVQQEQR